MTKPKAKAKKPSAAPIPARDGTGKYLTIEAACRVIGVRRPAIHTLLLDGVLTYEWIAGHRMLFREEVERYKAQRDADSP